MSLHLRAKTNRTESGSVSVSAARPSSSVVDPITTSPSASISEAVAAAVFVVPSVSRTNAGSKTLDTTLVFGAWRSKTRATERMKAAAITLGVLPYPVRKIRGIADVVSALRPE